MQAFQREKSYAQAEVCEKSYAQAEDLYLTSKAKGLGCQV